MKAIPLPFIGLCVVAIAGGLLLKGYDDADYAYTIAKIGARYTEMGVKRTWEEENQRVLAFAAKANISNLQAAKATLYWVRNVWQQYQTSPAP